MLAVSQLGGCSWLSAVTGPGSYQCYGGVDGEYVWAQFFGPLVLLDLPFTFVADTVSLPFCR
ncbi:YceK/YidQ family lipoprotein [Pseudomonas sp. NPDC087342]|uniref:YceK/YidQ family lipoprotein n=1 Tax=Pseudomonas sp. NPDC087342 TaxID=3364437 RepID=UPI0037F19C36